MPGYQLPEGAMLEPGEVLLGGIEIVAMLREDGSEGYRIRQGGDLTLSKQLGLLEIAKHEVYRYYADEED